MTEIIEQQNEFEVCNLKHVFKSEKQKTFDKLFDTK